MKDALEWDEQVLRVCGEAEVTLGCQKFEKRPSVSSLRIGIGLSIDLA